MTALAAIAAIWLTGMIPLGTLALFGRRGRLAAATRAVLVLAWPLVVPIGLILLTRESPAERNESL